MARGKNQLTVTRRLRSELADARSERARLESVLRAKDSKIEEIIRERDDIIENGTPQFQEDQARWKHGRAKMQELVDDSERIVDHLRKALGVVIKNWSIQLRDTEDCDPVVDEHFVALMHELFGAEFWEWNGIATDREERRELNARSPESIFASLRAARGTDWEALYGVGAKSMVSIEKDDDGKVRVVREERPDWARLPKRSV